MGVGRRVEPPPPSPQGRTSRHRDVRAAWLGRPLLSGVCSAIASPSPACFLLSGVWVASPEGDFAFNSARSGPQQRCRVPKERLERSSRTGLAAAPRAGRPGGGGLASSVFVPYLFEFSASEISPPCDPPLVEDHKLRCLPCMPFVCVLFLSLTAEPQPVWVPGAVSFQREPALRGSRIHLYPRN